MMETLVDIALEDCRKELRAVVEQLDDARQRGMVRKEFAERLTAYIERVLSDEGEAQKTH